MQHQHGSNLQNKPYHWLIVIIISLVVLSIFLLWIIFEPIIDFLFVNPEIHDGISHYTSEEYKEYDDAQVFDDWVESLKLNSDLLPVYFYHIDNSKHNTVLYGKTSDMYAIDFQAEKTTYDETKSRLLEGSTYMEKFHDYKIYSANREFADSNGRFLAFCDETNTVRCILILDRRSNEKSIYNYLVGETTLRFE